ncbi:MAG TPA: hypothetical protein VL485_01395 [Ktedonobacteraceae bacterium]|nr:hypothetical protein [Ktedonobacteraceae bacterium]
MSLLTSANFAGLHEFAGTSPYVFAERPGPFVEVWARKTTRLREAIEAIGLATGGEGELV